MEILLKIIASPILRRIALVVLCLVVVGAWFGYRKFKQTTALPEKVDEKPIEIVTPKKSSYDDLDRRLRAACKLHDDREKCKKKGK